jgi:FtsZ-binding cell division protein ZapB
MSYVRLHKDAIAEIEIEMNDLAEENSSLRKERDELQEKYNAAIAQLSRYKAAFPEIA